MDLATLKEKLKPEFGGVHVHFQMKDGRLAADVSAEVSVDFLPGDSEALVAQLLNLFLAGNSQGSSQPSNDSAT